MDSGTRDAAVSRTSPVRAGWMGLLTGRAVVSVACHAAAAVLVTFAVLFAAALPAQAQTTIWTATLTPRTTFSGTPVPLGCDNSSTGNRKCSNSNTLSDDFTDDGTTYAVTKFFTKNGVLTFKLDTGATAATQGLTLVIDGEEFVLKEADQINGAKTQWKWNSTTLGWTAGTDVAVSLVVTDAPATGQPTISGGGQVGKTLTAATDDIEDLDGLPTTPTFTYQWVRVDGSTDTDIPGAASETYTLTASDLGKQIKVTVSFTDLRGHAEGPLTSDAYPRNGTVTVVVLPGPCPAVNDWCATMTVADAEGDGRLLGYEYDKFGSLDDDQIEYGGENFNVWTVHNYKELSRAYFYFGSIPRVPRGTVVTVGERTFTTDMESDDGATGDLWHYPAGQLPPDLVWSDGQEVRVSLVLGSSAPTLSIEDASAAENAGHLLFDVTLSRASPHTVKVDFETISGGTATEGVDYWAHDYTHVIPAGETTTQMGFALIEDTVTDAGETVMVRLSNARLNNKRGRKIADINFTTAEATGTITAPSTTTTNVPGLTIRIQDATGSEDSGWLLFKVKLSKAYGDYVCYDFETISAGTATEGTDYLKIPKATYWMQIGKRVDDPFVRIIDDSVNDNGETVKVKISNAHLCDDPSQTISITEAEATGTTTETSSSGMDSSDDGDGDDALLARVGDVTPEAATAALFGGDALTGDQLAAMDQLGNRNGAYDLGDLLSWRARCRRNEVSCGAIVSATDAGSLPASPAMPPTKRSGRTPPRRRGNGHPGRRSGRNMGGSVERVPQQRAMRSGAAGRGPGRHGPAVRRVTGWIRALVLGLVVSAWGCGIGDNPVQPAQPDPGPLHVQLTVPPEARDIGAMLIVEGPGIDSLSAPVFELIQADEASSNRREAIIAGSLSTGPLLQVWVPDRRHLGDYRVQLVQVSGDDYGLKDVTQYGIAISR